MEYPYDPGRGNRGIPGIPARFLRRHIQARHKADYGEIVKFDAAEVQAAIEQAERFVAEMRRLLGNPAG